MAVWTCDFVMAMLDKLFCPKDTMSNAAQTQGLGEWTLKDGEDPHKFSLKIVSLELEYNNKLTKEEKSQPY